MTAAARARRWHGKSRAFAVMGLLAFLAAGCGWFSAERATPSASGAADKLRQAKQLLSSVIVATGTGTMRKLPRDVIDTNLDKAEKASALFRDAGDDKLAFLASMQAVRLHYYGTKDLPAMLEALDEAEQAGARAKCDECIADTLSIRGEHYAGRGGVSKARAQLERAALLYWLDGKLGKAARLYGTFGGYERSWGNYKSAKRHLESSHAVYEEKGDAAGRATAMTQLGAVAAEANDSKTALDALRRARKAAGQTTTKRDDLRVLGLIAVIRHAAGNVDDLEALFDEMDEIIETQSLNPTIARLHYHQAGALVATGRVARGQVAYEQAREKFEAEKTPLGIAAAEMKIAQLAISRKDLGLALSHNRAGLKIANRARNVPLSKNYFDRLPYSRDQLIAGLGLQEVTILVLQGLQHTAMGRINELEQRMSRTLDRHLLAKILILRASLHADAADFEKVEPLLSRAHGIYSATGNARGLASVERLRKSVAKSRGLNG